MKKVKLYSYNQLLQFHGDKDHQVRAVGRYLAALKWEGEGKVQNKYDLETFKRVSPCQGLADLCGCRPSILAGTGLASRDV